MVTLRKCSTWFARGAPPDTTTRTRPPRRALTAANATLSTIGSLAMPNLKQNSFILKQAEKIALISPEDDLTCRALSALQAGPRAPGNEWNFTRVTTGISLAESPAVLSDSKHQQLVAVKPLVLRQAGQQSIELVPSE